MIQLKHKILLLLALMVLGAATQQAVAQDNSNKKERNYIRSGNKLYNAKRYAEAEVEYNKALQANPQSEVATFNLATTLLRQGNGTASKDDKNDPASRAESMLQSLVKSTANRDLQSKAYYDLGNIAYSRQDYAQAIEHYKNALRRNPGDDHARDNLRLAQLKKKQQDQNKQNQDQNKDQNKDQDKNKDKDKNKDQNQDKDKQDKNKDNQDKNQDKQNQQQQPQQQQQGGMSQQNVEQILNTMQGKENATQQRVQAVQAQQQRHQRQATNHKW